jgi:hypothetical protein
LPSVFEAAVEVELVAVGVVAVVGTVAVCMVESSGEL